MLSKGASPVAFVEFSDTRLAASARSSLQGLALGTFGGIRIEYARNKMIQMVCIEVLRETESRNFVEETVVLFLFTLRVNDHHWYHTE